MDNRPAVQLEDEPSFRYHANLEWSLNWRLLDCLRSPSSDYMLLRYPVRAIRQWGIETIVVNARFL